MKRFILVVCCLGLAGLALSQPRRRNNAIQIRPQVNTVGLVAHYKLWAGLTSTGTVFDYSLNGNTGTVTGAVPVFPGFSFDAVDDDISCGSDASIADLFAGGGTFACWCLGSGRGENTRGRIASKNQWELFSTADITTLEFNQAFAAGDGEWRFSITAGVWQHIAIVYDNDLGANVPIFYVNGVSVDVTVGAVPGDDTAFSDAASNLCIGDNFASTSSWDGKIDDVMLFDKIKTAVEARNLFELTRWRYGI